ncbi:antibiotic biosynthesis monooxygenase [Bacillus sp. 31A1R]|uniref:Antibiotic biosynthesis monooxygenase n=1 Tax=Robertmurraya mangrovi TaxID=3098077 RepID=A0ABU5ISV9_9BACI|nr:antibiotic biosynthesis monooxygenase [Bacillus sp. 31A1R]MDZ5470221.1 antibiotic biosynthesis monooxygenase [Bacillus sp. 31A1R]
MNVFITSGTYEYLKQLQDKYTNETLILMQDEDTTLLLHETNGETIFNEPRQYEAIDSSGDLSKGSFAVLNNIPVTDEGRPVFEYRFKNRAGLIDSEPGFAAIRVLRPLSTDTYVILTLWESESDFLNWQQSKAYERAHKKRGTDEGIDKQSIFPRPSYVTKYQITIE